MSFVKYPTQDIKFYIEENFDNEKNILEYRKTKDIDLRNRIVNNNLLLVLNIAKVYEYPTKMSLGDLIAEGTLALINAIDKYVPNKDVLFSTYATESIKNEISGKVNEWYGDGNKYYGEAIKKYRSIAISMFDESKIYNEDIIDYVLDIMLQKELIRPGTIPEVKRRLLSTSLYEIEIDNNEIEFKVIEEAEYVPYDDGSDFDRTAFIKKYKDLLYSGLTDYEKEVMDYYCGFKDGIAHTQQEIAEIYGISHQAVQQQFKKAITKMRGKADSRL